MRCIHVVYLYLFKCEYLSNSHLVFLALVGFGRRPVLLGGCEHEAGGRHERVVRARPMADLWISGSAQAPPVDPKFKI